MDFKQNLKTFILKLNFKYLVIIFVILGFVILFSEDNRTHDDIDPTSVDTLIPQGMALIPIDIQNIEALKNIISDFGVVDLYLPSFESARPRKVASAVKLMRAPLNPDVFAVLVSEESASRIAQHPGAFFVTVLNPETTSGTVPKPTNRRQIIMETNL